MSGVCTGRIGEIGIEIGFTKRIRETASSPPTYKLPVINAHQVLNKKEIIQKEVKNYPHE